MRQFEKYLYVPIYIINIHLNNKLMNAMIIIFLLHLLIRVQIKILLHSQFNVYSSFLACQTYAYVLRPR